MKISFGTRLLPEDISTKNGYGYATDRMLDSLTRLGHQVNPNDEEAPVEIWFDQPFHTQYRDNQYKILYHPWESTELQEGWVDIMNNVDEVWSPSPLIAEWYKDAGIEKPIYIYEHGVDNIWSPRPTSHAKIGFLHVGAEAARKGGWDTLRAFRLAFPDKDDTFLTLKTTKIFFNIERVGKTNIINRDISLDELVNLYHEHSVYVYPSWGEGFGLTPLQAMACGIPTICTGAWAPYERFLDPNLVLDSTLKTSPWQDVHPGKMFRVTQDELVDKMRWAYENYDQAKDYAMSQVPKIKAEYDWDTLTESAFKSLENRLKIAQKSSL